MQTKQVNQKYQKIVQDEGQEKQFQGKKGLTAAQVHHQRAERLENFFEYIKDKLMSFLWVMAAGCVIYESNFFKVILESEYINRDFLNLSEIMFGIFVGLQMYAVFILPYVYGITEEIEDYSPKVLYIAALAMFIFFFSLVIAIWPVWGWKVIPMLFVMFFGYISTSAFLPGKFVGSLCSIAIFIAICKSHIYIEHDGKWHY